jgi:hypothetical protein
MKIEANQPTEGAVRGKAKRRLWSLVKTNQNSRGYDQDDSYEHRF